MIMDEGLEFELGVPTVPDLRDAEANTRRYRVSIGNYLKAGNNFWTLLE